MLKHNLSLIFISLTIFCQWMSVESIAPFTLPTYYTDNMMLQRAPYNAIIWGFASTNSIVSTTIFGKTYSAQAELLTGTTQYRWTIKLDPVEIIDQTLNILLTETRSDGVSTLTIKNVIFGDIWFCSGQSNMQLGLTKDLDGLNEINTGFQYDKIRLLSNDLRRSKVPIHDSLKLKHTWTSPNNATLGKGDWSQFSALCWYYGKELHLKTNVPIGLIVSAWTGTNIEQWAPLEVLQNCNDVGRDSDATLWYSMVSVFTRFSIYGAIWYQGEQNSAQGYKPELVYSCVFTNMISKWREYWNTNTTGSTNPKFPFGFVQIANADHNMTYVSYYPIVRWEQTAGYGYAPNPLLENVFMTTAVDLVDDETNDPVHPRHKKDVGLRLSLGALNLAYGQSSVEYYPPRINKICYRPNLSVKISLKSEYLPIVLEVKNTNGFEVCCDSSYCPANSTDSWTQINDFSVSGNEISFNIPSTCNVVNEVRYLWKQKPCYFKQCALYSQATQLPIYPFKFVVEDECVVGEWAQCGGIGYTGITKCDPTYGLVCNYQSDWFSQCIKSPLPPNTVAEWGQCGGLYYSGYTTCDIGLVCTYQNDYYSQCLKPTN